MRYCGRLRRSAEDDSTRKKPSSKPDEWVLRLCGISLPGGTFLWNLAPLVLAVVADVGPKSREDKYKQEA